MPVAYTSDPPVPAGLPALLQEEEVEKDCEGCGGANQPHSLRHTIRRLPRILVLHMKRFKARGLLLIRLPACPEL